MIIQIYNKDVINVESGMLIKLCILIFYLSLLFCSFSGENIEEEDVQTLDILQPYDNFHSRRTKRSNRHVKECQEIKYGDVTHSKTKVNPDSNLSFPLVEVKHITKNIGEYYMKNPVTVRYQQVNYPLNTLSVLEPIEPGTCHQSYGNRSTTSATAERANCIVAANGGFFNTTTGACLGNIVSNGRLVQDSGGVQNAHFGVTEDGYIYVGYLSELDLITQQFKQLIGGVLWIIRDGEVYIDKSKEMECSETEETGTLSRFINVQSARTAVGHDKEGRVILVQVDGKTGTRGVNLYEFANLLLELGVVNAINLDGGGSATTVINNTLVNYPSDKCVNSTFSCERKITTILCVHEPDCRPKDCNGHGRCVLGQCICDKYWSKSDCNALSCPQACNNNGLCTSDGCKCDPGWHNSNCSQTCEQGFYGYNCSSKCYCLNDGKCDPRTGVCDCAAGYSGRYCESDCPYGYYGKNCYNICTCDNGCFCHPITGSCNLSTLSTSLQQASSCLVEAEIKSHHLINVQSEEYGMCLSSVISMSTVAAISIILNISLICLYIISQKRHKTQTKEAVKQTIRRFVTLSSTESDVGSESEEADEETSFFTKSKKTKR